MAASQSMRPLAICSRCLSKQSTFSLPMRAFSTAPNLSQAAPATQAYTPQAPLIPTSELNPNSVSTVSEEQRLIKHRNLFPVGSRRRRAAIASKTSDIPFEQLPYQCFQEARNLLLQDREEKVKAIEKMRKRIAHVEGLSVEAAGGEPHRQHRLFSMRKELEYLKIQADINDPLVKKKFEDGLGDMNKPIYRHLANRKWHEMKRKILMQRITQMNVIPDVLPTIEPTLDVDLLWHKRIITPGDFVFSNWSENPPALRIQKFDKGEAKLTIVAVDSDVPNPETDSFESRCHGIWSNITISPTKTDAGTLTSKDVQAWSPPFAQKGSPYHRISLFIFEQPANTVITADQVKTFAANAFSNDFSLRDFVEKSGFKAVGCTMFRIQWDESMREVMERNGIEGADVEFRRTKPERLPEKDRVKDGLRYRGWRK